MLTATTTYVESPVARYISAQEAARAALEHRRSAEIQKIANVDVVETELGWVVVGERSNTDWHLRRDGTYRR